MSNLMYRHWHACTDCEQSWECFVPGACRDEKEKSCRHCDEDKDPEEEEGE